jgi:uncharacterized membrane protein YkoI
MRITKTIIAVGAGAVVLVAGGGAAYAMTAGAPTPKITAEKAMEIAHGKVPGAWVSEVDYDRRGSRADVWEIELVKGAERHELDVDAATGAVSGQELDHDDD